MALETDTVHFSLEAVLTGLLSIGAFVINAVRGDVAKLQEAHDTLAEQIPAVYARRDDMKDAILRIEDQHRQMNAKLDRLLERH